MLAYSTIFCTMFDLNNMDYVMEHIEFAKIMHPSWEPPKRKGSNNCLCKLLLIYAAVNIELRNCEMFPQSR